MLKSDEIRKSFNNYIHKVIKSKSIDYKRKLAIRQRREQKLEDSEIQKVSLLQEYNYANLELNINYRELEKVFTDKIFHNAMEELSDKYKQVLYFFVVKEMTSEEVGNILNITPNNARKIKERAIKQFLANLKKEGM